MSTHSLSNATFYSISLESQEEDTRFKVLNEHSKSHSVGVALCIGALFGLAVASASFFCTVPASYALLTVGGVLFLGGIPGITLLVKHQIQQEDAEAQSNPDEITKNLIPPGPIYSPGPILPVQVAMGINQNPTDIVQVPANSKGILDVPHQKNPEALSEKQQAQNLLAKMLKHPNKVTEDLIANNPHLFPKDKFDIYVFTQYKSLLLHRISRDGTPLLLEAFLEVDANHLQKINTKDNSVFLKTPLNLAIESGDLDKVKILLDKGANPKEGELGISDKNIPSGVYFSILFGTDEIVAYFLEQGFIDQNEIIEVLKNTGEISSEIYKLLLDHIIEEINEAQLRGMFLGLFQIPDIKRPMENLRRENFQLFYDKWKSHPNFDQFLNQKIDTEKTQNGPLNICRTELFQLALYALIFSPTLSNIKKVVLYATRSRDMFTLKILFAHHSFPALLVQYNSLHAYIEQELAFNQFFLERDKDFLKLAALEYQKVTGSAKTKIENPKSTKEDSDAVTNDEKASDDIIIVESKENM